MQVANTGTPQAYSDFDYQDLAGYLPLWTNLTAVLAQEASQSEATKVVESALAVFPVASALAAFQSVVRMVALAREFFPEELSESAPPSVLPVANLVARPESVPHPSRTLWSPRLYPKHHERHQTISYREPGRHA